MRSDYWLEISYEGPTQDPGLPPVTAQFDTLPLVPTSTGP
jgi:hypothetical protein